MWAAIRIGAGTASTPAWNGAPVLCPGATGKWDFPSRVLQTDIKNKNSFPAGVFFTENFK